MCNVMGDMVENEHDQELVSHLVVWIPEQDCVSFATFVFSLNVGAPILISFINLSCLVKETSFLLAAAELLLSFTELCKQYKL